ncbi:hypothetical protein [Cystobacter fuscus]|uniref:hypothetical protein n=1 Tax=Cystobacter fuscus TaxID=43 RepID=UPI0012DD5751|nr:hypothetical protein [Cystobacter fuscus]
MEPVVAEQFERELEGAVEAATARAIKWCKIYPWVGGTSVTVKDRAFEFVREALTLTLQGRRPWKNNSVPLAGHLIGTVQSLISNAIRSADAQTRSTDDPAAINEDRVDPINTRPQTPEGFYLSKEACEQIESDAYAAAGEDENLGKFIEAVIDGHYEVAELVEVTGMSADQIYAAKEKLKRRRAAILKKGKK